MQLLRLLARIVLPAPSLAREGASPHLPAAQPPAAPRLFACLVPCPSPPPGGGH